MTIPIAMDWVSTRTFPAGTRPASRPWSICSTCAPRVPRPHSLATLPPLGRHQTPPRIVCALISTRQGASSFNQPLSFDTSSVTDMTSMFYVRSARALPPSLQSEPSPCTRRLRRRRSMPPPGPPPRPAPHTLLSTRQRATAFNQPLSFDTSSVTNMLNMFRVRSAPALPP